MVAVSGAGWRLAPSLVALISETDRLFPNRDRLSDGSIGDLAHSTRDSDHNPSNGWVHAVDIDEDVAPGMTLDGFAAAVIARRDARVRYLIYEGRIVKSYVDSAGRAAWTWQPYTGANAHKQHLHVSINRTDGARNDTSPWWRTAPQEDDMTPEQAATLDRIHWMLEQVKPNADRIPAVQASTDLLSWGVLDPGQGLRVMVAELAGRDIDTIDEAEVARLVLSGLGDVDLSDEQVQSIIDAIPAQVKQALREGTG